MFKMKKLFLAVCFSLPVVANAQASKYYGWWEHKGALYTLDSTTSSTLAALSAQYHADTAIMHPLAETEIQFTEDSFALKLGISVLTGDGDSRDFRWFTTFSGTWQLDNSLGFKMRGKHITIRENSFTVGEDNWKDSIVNRTLFFKSDSADLVSLKFNNGQHGTGVFKMQKEYPYSWFYLEFGFGNIFTRFY